MRNFLKKNILFLILVILLSCFLYLTFFSNTVVPAQTGVILNPEDALSFINKVPKAKTGFFNPAGFVLSPDVFPARFKASGLLWEDAVLLGVRTVDNFYYAVQFLEFDYDSYEHFIIPFEENFQLSGIPVIPEDSCYFYEYMNLVIIDPATLNYCYCHSISIKMVNPAATLDPSVNPLITKAIYFFKY